MWISYPLQPKQIFLFFSLSLFVSPFLQPNSLLFLSFYVFSFTTKNYTFSLCLYFLLICNQNHFFFCLYLLLYNRKHYFFFLCQFSVYLNHQKITFYFCVYLRNSYFTFSVFPRFTLSPSLSFWPSQILRSFWQSFFQKQSSSISHSLSPILSLTPFLSLSLKRWAS